MATACRNDLELEVKKKLIWNTRLPYENEPRISPAFSLLGSEWCLRFFYCDAGGFYHNITLHQVSDEKILEEVKDLEKTFDCRTYIAATHNGDKIDAQNKTVKRTKQDVWYLSGKKKDEIFTKLPSLYDCPDIKIVCKFYGHPPSTFQLHIELETTLENSTTEETSNLECLSTDLGRLLENEQLPDVRLNCGGRTFPAHRSVLAARSEVFAAMFRNKMAESETGGVDIRDFDPDVIVQFLRYLYTGKLTVESGDAAASLFAVADKYAVDSLKRACTRRMVCGLTEGNCVRYLTVADLHGGEALKRKVAAFVCGHPEVMLGEEWAGLTRTHPEVALEVHRSFVRSKTET